MVEFFVTRGSAPGARPWQVYLVRITTTSGVVHFAAVCIQALPDDVKEATYTKKCGAVRWTAQDGNDDESPLHDECVAFEDEHTLRQALGALVQKASADEGARFDVFPLALTASKRDSQGPLLFSGASCVVATAKEFALIHNHQVLIQRRNPEGYRSYGSYPSVQEFTAHYAATPLAKRAFYEYYTASDVVKLFWDVEWFQLTADPLEVQRRLRAFTRNLRWALALFFPGVAYEDFPGVALVSEASRSKQVDGHAGQFWRPSFHGTHTGVVFPDGVRSQKIFWKIVEHRASTEQDDDFFYPKPAKQGHFVPKEAIADSAPYRPGELRVLGACKDENDVASVLRLIEPAELATAADIACNQAVIAASLVVNHRPPPGGQWDENSLFPSAPLQITLQDLIQQASELRLDLGRQAHGKQQVDDDDDEVQYAIDARIRAELDSTAEAPHARIYATLASHGIGGAVLIPRDGGRFDIAHPGSHGCKCHFQATHRTNRQWVVMGQDRTGHDGLWYRCYANSCRGRVCFLPCVNDRAPINDWRTAYPTGFSVDELLKIGNKAKWREEEALPLLLAYLCKYFALASMGGGSVQQTRVLERHCDDQKFGQPVWKMSSTKDFRDLYGNFNLPRFIPKPPPGKSEEKVGLATIKLKKKEEPKTTGDGMSIASLFLASKQAIVARFAGETFNPHPYDHEGAAPQNTWNWYLGPAIRDFSAGPLSANELLRVKPWSAHIRNILCSKNDAMTEYVYNWFASPYQRPHVKSGVCLVLRGGEGLGKGAALEPLARFWAEASSRLTTLTMCWAILRHFSNLP